MKRDEAVIEAINDLWLPVYPFMAEHVLALSRVPTGRILDLGPFAGGIALQVLGSGAPFRATVLDPSDQVLRWARERARQDRTSSRLTTRRTTLEPIPEPDGRFDLATVRGAFFFLTPTLLREVWRVLRPGGFGWVGGGYGPKTPDHVIAPIADRSRELNAVLGKRRASPQEAATVLAEAGLTGSGRVSTEGGLWIEIRK